MIKVILVIAGNYQQYCDWLKELNQEERKVCKYVYNEQGLLGYPRGTRITLVGTYHKNSLWRNPRIDISGHCLI